MIIVTFWYDNNLILKTHLSRLKILARYWQFCIKVSSLF